MRRREFVAGFGSAGPGGVASGIMAHPAVLDEARLEHAVSTATPPMGTRLTQPAAGRPCIDSTSSAGDFTRDRVGQMVEPSPLRENGG
jgi:hypothetical protein